MRSKIKEIADLFKKVVFHFWACDYFDMQCEHGGTPWGFVPNCYCICTEGYSGTFCGIHPGNYYASFLITFRNLIATFWW